VPADIISLLQEARDRVEKTKEAVRLVIEFTADVENNNDDKEVNLLEKTSEVHQTQKISFLSKLDRDYREIQIAGVKQQLINQTKNQNKLLIEASRYGSLTSAPLKLQNDIEDIETYIAELEEKLKRLEENF
jgi:hypothetical protein